MEHLLRNKIILSAAMSKRRRRLERYELWPRAILFCSRLLGEALPGQNPGSMLLLDIFSSFIARQSSRVVSYKMLVLQQGGL
jgi:hypothetical protein